jgi:hypothetical protein
MLTLALLAAGIAFASAQSECSLSAPNYSIAYYIDGCTNRAVFQLTHDLRSTPNSDYVWSGVGIGMGRNMADIDFIQLNVDKARAKVTVVDMRVKGYSRPYSDGDNGQNVQLDAYNLASNVLTARFSRPITTSDDDADLSMAHDFILPVGGGSSSAAKSVSKHRRTPVIRTGIRVTDCKRQCSPSATQPPQPQATTEAPFSGCSYKSDSASWCKQYLQNWKRSYMQEGSQGRGSSLAVCAAFKSAVGTRCEQTACRCDGSGE